MARHTWTCTARFPMCLADGIGNTHQLEDFTGDRIATKPIVGGSKIDLARILTSGQVSSQGSIPIPIDKENVPTSHTGGNRHGIFRFKGLADAESTTTPKIATNYQGTVRFNPSSSPHFADAVRPNQQFTPSRIMAKKNHDIKL